MINNNLKRLIVKIFGQVQGVFFRSYTQKTAEDLGLTGWVQNESDGSVLVIAEGEKLKLKDFLEFLKKGPNSARVSKIEIKWEKATGEFKNFEIKY